jgi:hypothetical protein
VHLSVIKVFVALNPADKWIGAMTGIVCSNLVAVVFALTFEHRYRAIGQWIKAHVDSPVVK